MICSKCPYPVFDSEAVLGTYLGPITVKDLLLAFYVQKCEIKDQKKAVKPCVIPWSLMKDQFAFRIKGGYLDFIQPW